MEHGSLVSVLFRGPACRHGACTPRLDGWRIGWFFSVSLLAQGLGGFVFARIGGCWVRGFFLDMIGLQMVWSSHLSEAVYAVKVSLFRSWSAPLSLLFPLLK